MNTLSNGINNTNTNANKNKTIPKFSDFAKECDKVRPTKVSINAILDKPIILTAYTIKPSKYPKKDNDKYTELYITLVETDTEAYTTTGSAVIRDQCERYKDHIPFSTKITRRGNYFSFN